MSVTYYHVLEVDRDAEQDEIREAYKKKLHEYHPDTSSHPKAQELFLIIKDASEVLTDPERRQDYDNKGHDAYVEQSGGIKIDDEIKEIIIGDGSATQEDGSDESTTKDSESDESTSERSDSGDGWSTDADPDEEQERKRRRRDEDDSRNTRNKRGRGQRDRTTTESRRSAADDYRDRLRQGRSRSRSDRSSSRERSRGSTTTETSGGTEESTTSAETRQEATSKDSAEKETTGWSTEQTRTATRGYGQPAAAGMFVSPDIELLRFPALLIYYFIGIETGLSLYLATVFIAPYAYYRRHKFTERLLTEDIISDDDHSSVIKRIKIGSTFSGLLIAVLGIAVIDGSISFAPTEQGVVLLSAGAFAGLVVSLYSFAQLLLYDWIEQNVTNPVFWDVVSRGAALIAPFIIAQPEGFPEPLALSIGLLLIATLLPMIYMIKQGDE